MKREAILAVETSCDDTCAAVIIDGVIASNIVSSQTEIHAPYGGVVPEIASRSHLEHLPSVIDLALSTAQISKNDLCAAAVTYGPGLVGALLAGLTYAKTLAYSLGIPLIGVNHLAGHISANFISGAKPPFMCLIASGGHSSLVIVRDYTEFEVIGTTTDDAAGEAFDKVARTLGLGYPGGLSLDIEAEKGNASAVELPRPKLKEDNFDFSFSGLKSAVLNYINKSKMTGNEIIREDVCASFRQSVSDVLTEKTIRACEEYGLDSICICGGVSANSLLRSEFIRKCTQKNIKLTMPPLDLCSDNAAMIAQAAYCLYKEGRFSDYWLNAEPNLPL